MLMNGKTVDSLNHIGFYFVIILYINRVYGREFCIEYNHKGTVNV